MTDSTKLNRRQLREFGAGLGVAVHRVLRPVLELLARLNNWVLLGLLFFGILWPVGWVLRMTGRLQYRTGRDPDARSYRVPVDRNRVTRLEEPF